MANALHNSDKDLHNLQMLFPDFQRKAKKRSRHGFWQLPFCYSFSDKGVLLTSGSKILTYVPCTSLVFFQFFGYGKLYLLTSLIE